MVSVCVCGGVIFLFNHLLCFFSRVDVSHISIKNVGQQVDANHVTIQYDLVL